MANGNMGDLFITLGLKDELTRSLGKIVNDLNKTDAAAKQVGSTLIRELNSAKNVNPAKTFKDALAYIEQYGHKIENVNKHLLALQGLDVSTAFGKGFSSIDTDLGKLVDRLRKAREIIEQSVKSSDKNTLADAEKWGNAVNSALKYMRILQQVNSLENSVALTKKSNPNVDTKTLDASLKKIQEFRNSLYRTFTDSGIDVSSGFMSDMVKMLGMLRTEVRETNATFKKENPLSVFEGGAAKTEAEISRVTEKLATLRDLINEGRKKGYNTSMLLPQYHELGGLLNRLTNTKGNGSLLTDTTHMKSLFSDLSVEIRKTEDAMHAYGREKGKAIAQTKEADVQKRKIEERLNATRSLIDLQNQLNHIANQAENGVGMKGLNLGADVTSLSSKIGELRDFVNKLGGVNVATMGLGGRKDFADYKSEAKSLVYALQEAIQAQRELNTVKNAANKEAQRKQDKADAQAKRDAAKAAREDAAAEKQRQMELEQTQRRIQSMEKALANLQEKRHTAKLFDFDTSEADRKIAHLKSQLADLRNILIRLATKNPAAIGQLGQIGNGREVQAANNLAAIYDKVNKEAERGIRLEEQRKQKIAESASKVRSDLVKGFEQASSAASKMNSALSDIKSLFLQGGIVYGAWQFANSIIQTGGEMEKQHIALQSILGDMQNANTMFNQIKELALNSPFTFSELNRDVKQLAAYGVEYDKLYDTTKRLADMSSGLGVSFDRIALAFGQVQARGWLDGKELRQIAYAGIPLLNKLSEYYSKAEGKSVSTSEVKTRISKREVSFDDVKNIFWEMTNQGGQFYNMQQTLSETLLGRYNKLKDAWEIMLSEFASGNSLVGGFFKIALDGATKLVQTLHTLAPVVAAMFTSTIARKGMLALGGGKASSYLDNKKNVASDISRRVLQGKQLSAIEQNILATKNKITSTDIRNGTYTGALNKTELKRLYVSGQINGELYRQGTAILGLQAGLSKAQVRAELLSGSLRRAGSASVWSNFAARAQVAFELIGTAAKSLGASIWAAIGGLPGLVITGLTMGITYAISSYQELSQKIKQTQDEIADRQSQINKFLQENNAGEAIGSGDAKQIDNMIDAYKDKLKELAPYSYNNMLMDAGEKKSHEDRLKYLQEEINLLRQANDIASKKTSDRGTYSDMEDSVKESLDKLESMQSLYASATRMNKPIDKVDLFDERDAFSKQINEFKEVIAKQFGDIGQDEKMREAAMQAMSGIFSELGVPEDKANQIRASVLQAFGCGDKSGWLQGEVVNSMTNLIDTTFPMIGAKIKANIPLTDAEKAKVKELMQDAKQGLVNQYPELEATLKNMLAASNFKAVIKLVYDTGDKYNDVQSELVGRIPGIAGEKLSSKYRSRAVEYGKDNNWYNARNAAKNNIDTAFNNWESAKKSGAKNTNQLWQEYQDEMDIAQTLLHYDYKGEGKKSNKPGKKNTGRQEDKELKALEERLSSLKSARQMYQKYQPYMSDETAKKKTLESFPEVTGLNLDNYKEAVESLLNGFKINTTERKKFQTSVYREVAEWLFEENDKKEFEAKAATFSEEMSKLSERWDAYKSLLEKTGDKNYASSAFVDTFLENDKTSELMNLYAQHYGKRLENEDLHLSDGDAKKQFKLPNQYEEWKKIVDLLRSNYVQALNDGADAINQTMSTAEKLKAVTAKYNKKRDNAGGDEDLKARYDYLEKQEKSGILFEQLKGQVNWEGVFGNLGNYTKKELRKVRKDLNELIKGGILNGMQTSDVQSFYDGMNKLNEAIDGKGFGGMAELVKELAVASKQYDDAVMEYNLALAGGADWQIEAAKKKMQAAENQKHTAEGNIKTKKQSNFDNIMTLGNMFVTLGKGDGSGSTLLSNAGSWAQTISSMFGASDKNSSKIGSIVGMFAGITEAIKEKGADKFLSSAFEDIGGAIRSIHDSKGLGAVLNPLGRGVTGIFGKKTLISKFFNPTDLLTTADYDDYNDAKEEYNNLIDVWDTLISKKKQYMSEHWGTEAENASKEALSLLQSEIEQTKELAKIRLSSGSSAGSHAIWYRMWKGSYDYNGTNWQDVAGEISSKYGVQFSSMEDMLNMAPDVLEKIKTDYSGLWAHMDSDFKEYLDKIIEYGDQVDDMTEELTEKLTGNKFSDLVSSWGDAMASMANSSDNLVDHFEDNLKKTILNSMVENIYGKQIKSLLSKTQSYAENSDKLTSSDGSTVSEYTGEEYAEIINDTEELSKQIEATRDYLKNTYHWSDDSSSSSTNTVKGITEETADIIVSYLNAIRLDVSVNRENVKLIANAVGDIPDLTIIARSQLSQLDSIAQNTLRNADAAEEIASLFKAVTNGTKKVYMS